MKNCGSRGGTTDEGGDWVILGAVDDQCFAFAMAACPDIGHFEESESGGSVGLVL